MRAEKQALNTAHNGVTLGQAIENVKKAKGRWVKAEWAVMAFMGISLAAEAFNPRYSLSWLTHAPTPIFLSGALGPMAFFLVAISQKGRLNQQSLRLEGTVDQLVMGDKDLTNASKEHLDRVWQGLEVLVFTDEGREKSTLGLKHDRITLGQAIAEVKRSKARWENAAKLMITLVGAAYLTCIVSRVDLSELEPIKLVKISAPVFIAIAGHVFARHKVEQLRTRMDNLESTKVKIYSKQKDQAWVDTLSPDKRSRIWKGLEHAEVEDDA